MRVSFFVALAALSTAQAVAVDYKTLSKLNKRGDGIPDFSWCGYHASNDRLPDADRAATKTLGPGSGDQAKRIQDALDAVAKAGGGVVALKAGEYQLSSTLTIPSKTGLRGAGQDKTTLLPDSGSWHAVVMGPAKPGDAKVGISTDITDKYVPVGSNKVTVKSSSGFSVGQTVWVERKATQKWIDANGMGHLVNSDGSLTATGQAYNS